MAGVFQTFYLLFKSNADDVIKGNKAVEKSTKDLEQNLKNTRDTTKETGENFVKMAESIAGAIGAVSGFEILKSGVQTVIDLNTNLKTVAENYGMTAQQLRAAGVAAKSAGGDLQSGMQDAVKIADFNRKTFGSSGTPEQNIRKLRGVMQGLPIQGQQQLMDTLSLDMGNRRIATPGLMSDTEVNKVFGNATDLTKGTNEAANAAYLARQGEVNLDTEQQNFFNNFLVEFQQQINKLIKSLTDVVNLAAGNPAAGAAAVVAGKTVEAYGGFKILQKVFGFGGEAADAGGAAEGIGLAGLLGESLLYGGGGVAAGYGLVSLYQDEIEKALVNYMTRDIKNPKKLSSALKINGSGNPDVDYAMSRGLSGAGAAGMISSMYAESGTGLIGDHGTSRGFFMWKKPRRDAILAATDVDVWDPHITKQKSIDAAIWEMKNGKTGFNFDTYNKISDPYAAGAYFSNNFEFPLDRAGQAAKRGKNALALASQLSSTGGSNINVQIGKIDVVTQATDANAIATGIAGALENKIYTALGFVASNVDTGVVR